MIPVARETALQLNEAGLFTVASVRHPLDRAVGAVYRLASDQGVPDLADRLRTLLDEGNIHVLPQLPLLAGFRIDFRLRFEQLAEDWAALREQMELPELIHRNENITRPPGWRDAADWEPFMPYYQQDFSLNDAWERP